LSVGKNFSIGNRLTSSQLWRREKGKSRKGEIEISERKSSRPAATGWSVNDLKKEFSDDLGATRRSDL